MCSSEGIQVGSVASAMGVLGTWTGEAHSERDPVGEHLVGNNFAYLKLSVLFKGPFWLWKVDDME